METMAGNSDNRNYNIMIISRARRWHEVGKEDKIKMKKKEVGEKRWRKKEWWRKKGRWRQRRRESIFTSAIVTVSEGHTLVSYIPHPLY